MNRWVLAIICFFFGVLGIHRFVVGKIGTGVLYLLTAGLFGIGLIIDFVMLLLGTFTDKSGNQIK
ncbi:MAG: TM2 domain-containing protein [Clostridia bacterium]|nr:TM2 domain-containing protein [Clostridia bacterium]